jgi:hypothetical protein
MMVVKGRGGEIAFEGDYVTIRRQGMLAALTVGIQGDKKIYVGDISAVELREAGLVLNGFIRFSFRGGQEALGGILARTQDENALMFTTVSNIEMLALRKAIEARMAELRATSVTRNPGPVSVADEIAKFATLREKGLLTADEFEAKKKQLLGL